MTEFVKTVAFLNIAGEIVILGQFVRLRLLSTYRYFSLYLAFSATVDIASSFFNSGGREYLWFWNVTVSVGVILLLAAVLELYSLIIHRFVGIGRWGGWVFAIAAGMGIGISALVGLWDANALQLFGVYAAVVYCKRWLLSVLAVLLLLSAGFFFRFESVMTRNLVVHSRVLTLFCLAQAAACLALNLRVDSQLVSPWLLTACSVCYLLWITLLSAKGEQAAVLPMSAEEVDRVRRMQQRISGALGLPRPDRNDGGGAGVE